MIGLTIMLFVIGAVGVGVGLASIAGLVQRNYGLDELLVLIGAACISFGYLTLMVGARPEYPTPSKICARHRGVSSIADREGWVVCKDGHATDKVSL